jgi:hypothetical protein
MIGFKCRIMYVLFEYLSKLGLPPWNATKVELDFIGSGGHLESAQSTRTHMGLTKLLKLMTPSPTVWPTPAFVIPSPHIIVMNNCWKPNHNPHSILFFLVWVRTPVAWRQRDNTWPLLLLWWASSPAHTCRFRYPHVSPAMESLGGSPSFTWHQLCFLQWQWLRQLMCVWRCWRDKEGVRAHTNVTCVHALAAMGNTWPR